jgi:hypothetical protein
MFGLGTALGQNLFHEALRIGHVAKAEGGHGVIEEARIVYQVIGRFYVANILFEIACRHGHGRGLRRGRKPSVHAIGDCEIGRQGRHLIGIRLKTAELAFGLKIIGRSKFR